MTHTPMQERMSINPVTAALFGGAVAVLTFFAALIVFALPIDEGSPSRYAPAAIVITPFVVGPLAAIAHLFFSWRRNKRG